jgi:hypothetical protein
MSVGMGRPGGYLDLDGGVRSSMMYWTPRRSYGPSVVTARTVLLCPDNYARARTSPFESLGAVRMHPQFASVAE